MIVFSLVSAKENLKCSISHEKCSIADQLPRKQTCKPSGLIGFRKTKSDSIVF